MECRLATNRNELYLATERPKRRRAAELQMGVRAISNGEVFRLVATSKGILPLKGCMPDTNEDLTYDT